MTESKHLQLIDAYIQSTNLANILQSSLRTLISGEVLPDNPFGVLARHMGFYAARSDLEKLLIQVRSLEPNPLTEPNAFGLVCVEDNPRAWGLPGVVSLVDVNRVEKLCWAMQDALKEYKGKRGQILMEVVTSLGGGQVYSPDTVSVPDFASDPLVIRAECLVEAPDFEHCFNFYSDWVYDDLMRIGSSNSLHYVSDFVVEQSLSEFHFKRLPFSEFKSNKQLFVSELRSATLQKKASYVRLMLFSLDLGKNSVSQLTQAPRPSLTINFATDSSAELTDSFEFVTTKKVYSLQFIERRSPESQISLKSFSCCPGLGLFEGVFMNRSSAERYASWFCARGSTILNTPALQQYTEYKAARISHFDNTCQINKCVWEMFELSTIEKNRTLQEETLKVIEHDASNLAHLKRRCKMLKILVEAFYDTNFPHFKKLAETDFAQLKEAFLSVFSRSATQEFILLKPSIERMLKAVSVHGSRALNFSNDTLRILSSLEDMCDCASRNNTEMLARHCKAIPKRLSQEGLSHRELLENKETELVFDAGQDLRRLAEYLANTGVLELMTQTTKGLLLSYPLLPNPLQVYGAKMVAASAKYDMHSASSPKPRTLKELARGVAVLQPDPIYAPRSLPYLVGQSFLMNAVEAEEVAYFKLLFHNYEIKHVDSRNALPPGYSLKALVSMCGASLFNKKLFNRQRVQWTTSLDVFLKGASFHAAAHAFVDLLLQYASWLDRSTDAVVIGFFTAHSPMSLAPQSALVSPTERQEAFSSILSAFQINSQVWLQFLIPFKGDSLIRVPASYRSVRVLCNMHYSNGPSMLSLVKPVFFEDCTRIFFDKNDYSLWTKVAEARDLGETMNDCMEAALDIGDFHKTYMISALVKHLEGSKEEAEWILSMQSTPLSMLTEALSLTEVMQIVVELVLARDTKVTNEFYEVFVDYWQSFVQQVLRHERNVHLESLQPRLITCLRSLDLKQRGFLSRLQTRLGWVCKSLRAMCASAAMAVHEALSRTV